MMSNKFTEKIGKTADLVLVTGLNYITGMDNSHLSAADIVVYVKDWVYDIIKKN